MDEQEQNLDNLAGEDLNSDYIEIKSGFVGYEKGDPRNLKGKAMVYSTLNLDVNENQFDLEKLGLFAEKTGITDFVSVSELLKTEMIIATYITNDVNDLKERFDLPQDNIDDILEQLDQFKEHASSVGGFVMPFFPSNILVLSPEELMEGDYDVLCMGTYSDPDPCGHSIKMGLDLYSLQYGDQLSKSGKINEFMPKNQLAYEQIEGDLEEHLVNEFVNPLVIANRLGNDKKFYELKNKLIAFSKDTCFSKYALELCGIIEHDSSNSDLIKSYVTDIVDSTNQS
jgi:hypothetical protein